jgi:hypothetical protein
VLLKMTAWFDGTYGSSQIMTLPSVFAVIVVHDNHTGSALVYESVRVADRRYRIVPRSFYQQDVTPTFTMANRPMGRAWPEITLMVRACGTACRDGETILYNGEWWATGESVYTVYHPSPIPALGFTDRLFRAAWPQTDNCLELTRGNPWSLQFWERRWNPVAIYEDLQRPVVGGSQPLVGESPGNTVNEQTVASRVVSGADSSSNAVTPRQSVNPPPKFVTDLIVADAVGRRATCPITMDSARVTPCFHVFDATALAAWLAAGNETCPVCKGGL